MSKIEFRNLYQQFFGNKAKSEIKGATHFQLLNQIFGNVTNFNGQIYDEATVRSCIHTIATNCAKLKPQHRKSRTVINDSLNRILSLRPNQYMSSFEFIYKIVTQLLCSSNSFVYIHRDGFGRIVGFYPINFSNLRMLEYQGETFVEFSFMNSKKVVLPYADLIHIRRHFNENDIFGTSPREPLKMPLDVLSAISQGIINSIKLSAGLRGLLQFKTVTPDDKQKKKKEEFVNSYMNINNSDGIATLDPSAEFKELKVEPQTADEGQTSIARENVYRFFNVSEDIIRSKYNEEEYNAFYSSVIEPIAIQLSLEFTYKVFSEKEIGHGNEIIFSAERMTFASNATKADVISKLMPLGIYSINQACEIMEMPKIDAPFADKHLMSLNYVDISKANQYQKVDNKDEDDGNNGSINKNDDNKTQLDSGKDTESENDAND
ncbi:MAG: phage portal protein [Candidatus Gastranaerophilales bacterium]|nr:phage portal protein [Candidatus Gastranaerophilales bacterium]